MKRNDGIVIVASLIVMMVIIAIAVGMLFLTQSNLKVTDNARSKASAQALADSGTDAMLIALENYYANNDNSLPNTFNKTNQTFNGGFIKPALVVGDITTPYIIEKFEAVGSDGDFVLAVSSQTANGASHISEVLFKGKEDEGDLQPLYGRGLESEGIVDLRGGSNFVSAGLHGNAGYNIVSFSNTTWKTCLQRDPVTGLCTSTQNININQLPVSAASNRTSWTCNPESSTVCLGTTPRVLTNPITVTPNYVARRDAAIADASQGGNWSNQFGINCDTRHTTAPTNLTTSNLRINGFIPGRTVCVESGQLTLPNGVSLDDVNIISRGSISVSGNSSILFSQSLLVSTEGTVSASTNKVTVSNSSIYSQGPLNFNGQQSKWEGVTTLASASTISVNGQSKVTTVANQPKIGIGLVAEGDVTIRGSSHWFASTITGGSFTYNGTSVLHGSVAAKGTILVHGGIDIDSGLDITNDDFLENEEIVYLSENSRR
jgi:hypothetical protein